MRRSEDFPMLKLLFHPLWLTCKAASTTKRQRNWSAAALVIFRWLTAFEVTCSFVMEEIQYWLEMGSWSAGHYTQANHFGSRGASLETTTTCLSCYSTACWRCVPSWCVRLIFQRCFIKVCLRMKARPLWRPNFRTATSDVLPQYTTLHISRWLFIFLNCLTFIN